MPKITIVWGQEASKIYSNCFDTTKLDKKSVAEELKACYGEGVFSQLAVRTMRNQIRTYYFKSDAEVNAFLKGVNEANGWESFEVVPEHTFEFIKKNFQGR